MQRKTLLALLVSGAIAILAVVTWRAPEKGTRTGPRPRPFPAFKAADVKHISITTNTGRDHVELQLEGASWKVTAPSRWEGDQTTIKGTVDQLDRLSFADIVTENPDKFGEFEVDEEKGAHVIAKDGAGKVLLDGWMGKSVAGYTMFRPQDKKEVWQAGGIFKYAFARDVKSWRDHTIFDFKPEDVSKLEVEASGQKLALERIPPADKGAAEAKWKVLEGTVRVDPLDDGTANSLVQAMGTLRAAGFDDEAKAATVGVEPARMRITATVKGEAKTLLVGNVRGDDAWVQVAGNPQIFLVQKYTAERLGQTPLDFRDKTLAKLGEADLTEIEVSYGGETFSLRHEGANWKLSKGEADAAKVKGLVSAFEDLKAAGFAVGINPALTGLAKPTGTVTLRLRDKSQLVLKVGALKDDEYYVSKSGQPDVFRLKKYNAERFLKKASDLTPTSTAANPTE